MPSIDATRWMAFVDGENLTIRAQHHPELKDLNLDSLPTYFLRDVFIWVPKLAIEMTLRVGFPLSGFPTRAYYYTSVAGDDPKILSVRESIRALGFDPQVFKKDGPGQKSKGVDITLTKDMLTHAFFNHYDAAVLVAGDRDYVPLIQEVKRLGKSVFVSFFREEHGLAKEVRLNADRYEDLAGWLVNQWKAHGQAQG
jgi:uncharacterized LabA/DUF88 family protein